MSEERGRGFYKDPYSEEGDENRMRGAPVKRKAIPGSLIDKLLNNPHAALRREPQRWRPPADTEHQKRHHAGERVAVKKTSLTAQQHLLDGGKVSYYLVVRIRNLIPTMISGYRPRAKIHQVFHLTFWP
jgi:hypothetical protein